VETIDEKFAVSGLAMAALRLVLLFVVALVLTGCAGPNYAPYDNMTNSYG
jgi:hypothetical protein